jgi:hypothetical protein
MTRNLGTIDRVLRVLGALVLMAAAVLAPLSLTTRLLAFAAPAVYILFTAGAGLCLGYAMLGRSTCAAPPAKR